MSTSNELCSHNIRLEAWGKKRDYAFPEAKTKVLISSAVTAQVVTAQVICIFVLAYEGGSGISVIGVILR